MSTPTDQPTVLWEPSEEQIEHATITRFSRWVAETRDVDVADDYHALWRWSVEDLEGFWAAIWEFFDVQLETAATSGCSARARCPARSGSRARGSTTREHIFRGKRRRRRRDPPCVASCASSASGRGASCARTTARIAAGLRALGVERGRPGRRVHPEHPRGGRRRSWRARRSARSWSSCSPDFGARSVVDRFAQIEPKVLLAVDGYRYGGKDFDRRDAVARLRARCRRSSNRRAAVPRRCGSAARRRR